MCGIQNCAGACSECYLRSSQCRVQPWWGVASHKMLNQAPHPAVSTGTSSGWRAAQGLGSLQNSPHFSHRGQREQGQSWPVGMGEDGQGQRRRQFRLNIPVLVPSACTASSELTGGVHWGCREPCRQYINWFSPNTPQHHCSLCQHPEKAAALGQCTFRVHSLLLWLWFSRSFPEKVL